VLGVLCAAIGAAMATEVVKLICGLGRSLLGRVQVYDAMESSWRTVPLRPRPDQTPVTELTDLPAGCVVTASDVAAGGPAAATITARDLRELLAARERGELRLTLLDIREPHEHRRESIPGAESVPMAELTTWLASHPDRATGRLILHCQGGSRSARALVGLLAAGHRAEHLEGGVLAWLAETAPKS
jgi:adenylyltransferase/sulfurtransferase